MSPTIDPNHAVCRDVRMQMRDGVALFADIYLPARGGVVDPDAKFPVVLVRTPYNKEDVSSMAGMPRRMTQRGYVVTIQDTRGTNTSEGVLEPLVDDSWGERQDGADTVAWLLEQPWCDGRIVTTGGSYVGGVQLLMAAMGLEGLETSFVQIPAVNMFGRGWFAGDMLDLSCAFPWSLIIAPTAVAKLGADVQAGVEKDLAEAGLSPTTILERFSAVFGLLRGRSFRDAPVVRWLPFWREWLANRDEPSFFANSDVRARYDKVRIPLMHFTGWYDLFLQNSLEAYAEISDHGATPRAREGQRLIVGPWGHLTDPTFRQFPDWQVDHVAAMAAWFDHHLRGAHHPTFDHKVILYVMGENRWRAEETWPPPGAVATRLYLHSNGRANGSGSDGSLSKTAPGDEPSDRFVSDPANPVPALGGHSLSGAAVDQTPNDDRTDLLVYSTPPLEEDVEVTSSIRATLYAASSATDTDWFIKLIDVFPDGRAFNIVTGAARARYRKSRTAPVPLVPGEVEAYEIDMRATSNVFKKGHRIRVVIASTDYPNADLNPNAFIDLSDATEADYVIANQTVFHDAARPSFIELPIIPLSRARNWISPPFPKTMVGHYYQSQLAEPEAIAPEPAPIEIDSI